MARAVGMELTEASVKLLHLERNAKEAKVLGFFEGPVPAGEAPWEDRAAGALREAFAASRIPRVGVAASICSGEAILREVSLPFKEPDQVRKTVRFEMESQIHNYTVEQLVVSHYRTGATDRGTLLMAAAVPKEVLGRRLKVLERAGVDPVSVDLDACALFNALHYAEAIPSGEPHLLLYGTPKFTKLIFVEEGQPRSIRTLRFSLPAGAAPGESEAGERDALATLLAREIFRFLLANASAVSPSHILLCGDFEDAEAARQIEAATKIPVKSFDLLGKVGHAFGPAARQLGPRVAVPLGLALKGTGVDVLGMDFRQEEFSYRRKFEAIRTSALVALQLVLVLLSTVALHYYFVREDVRQATAEVLGRQQILFQDATGLSCEEPSTAHERMADHLRGLQGGGRQGVPLERTAREAWCDLFRALEGLQRKYAHQKLGDGDLFVEMDQIRVTQNTVPGNESFDLLLQGKARNIEFAEALRNEVAAVGGPFKEAGLGELSPIQGQDLVQFKLQAHQGKRGK